LKFKCKEKYWFCILSDRKNIKPHFELPPGALHHPLSMHREGESLQRKLGVSYKRRKETEKTTIIRITN